MRLHSSSQGLVVAIGTAAGLSLDEYAQQCHNNGIASDKLLIDTAEGRYEYLADHEIERLPRMTTAMMASALAKRAETQCEALALQSSGVADTEHGAAGKPIVATDVGGNPEAVDNGKTGLLAAPRDPESIAGCIMQLLPNAPYASLTLGKTGRKRLLEAYTADRMHQLYAHHYESLARDSQS